MSKLATLFGHQWLPPISLPCFGIHLLSNIGVAAISFYSPIFWSSTEIDGQNNNLPLKVVSIIGLALSLLNMLMLVWLRRYLAPHAVFFPTLALTVTWIALMGHIGASLNTALNGDYGNHRGGFAVLIRDYDADVSAFAASYSLMTFVVVSGVYVILLSIYVIINPPLREPKSRQIPAHKENNDMVADSALPEACDMPVSNSISPHELAGQSPAQYSPAVHIPTTGADSFGRAAELEAGASRYPVQPTPRRLVIDGVVFQAVQ